MNLKVMFLFIKDINNGKYTNAKYEDGLVYYIGKVNEGSTDERGDDWGVMKYLSISGKETIVPDTFTTRWECESKRHRWSSFYELHFFR